MPQRCFFSVNIRHRIRELLCARRRSRIAEMKNLFRAESKQGIKFKTDVRFRRRTADNIERHGLNKAPELSSVPSARIRNNRQVVYVIRMQILSAVIDDQRIYIHGYEVRVDLFRIQFNIFFVTRSAESACIMYERQKIHICEFIRESCFIHTAVMLQSIVQFTVGLVKQRVTDNRGA